MPKFCANLTLLFNEVDFLDRFEAASKSGFQAVEYLFPYAYDKTLLADKLKTYGLRQALFNLPAGDWAAGERGLAILPDRVGEFQDGVGRAIDYAAALGCGQLNFLAGLTPPDADPDLVHKTLMENLKFAANELGKAGLRLLVEAINTFDMPGFHITATGQAAGLIKEAGADNVFILYDVYHMQRMEGELTATIRNYFSQIGHIQIADNPGRHEPGTGEINFPFLFSVIDELGYSGWVGAEYKPRGQTAAGLSWLRPFKAP